MQKLKRAGFTAASFVVILLVMLLLGQAMTPDWRVEPYRDHLRVSTRSTAVASSLGPTTPEGTHPVKEQRISITLAGGVHIQAIVREPSDLKGTGPACLFIHGAGTGKSSEVFGDLASAMASAGITTLVPDKRLDTYTTFHRDYQAMAADYGRSLDRLRSWPGVDPTKVGLYAESEGTWISSIMTAKDPSIAFSILTSPPVYPGRRQMAMAATSYLDLIGATKGIRNVIPRLMGMDLSLLGLEYADFPSLPYLDQLRMPVMINFGTMDVSMPVEQGAREIIRRTHAIGNDNVTLRYYPTNHQIRTGSRLAKAGLPLEPRYTHNLEDWINAVAMGTKADQWSTPMIAGSQPHQLNQVPKHTNTGLMPSLTALLTLMASGPILLAAALASALVGALSSHLRTRGKDHRQSGFSKGLTGRLWSLGLLAAGLMTALLAYAFTVVRRAFGLMHLSSMMASCWSLLSILCLVLILLLASTLTCIFSQSDGKPAVAGAGHWLTLTLTLLGSLAILGSLIFWNTLVF
ncbi:acyl-CoA thioester hydrolase/BAAT C-terminal domain-containing protein [Bifidobacterium sp. H6bp22N]|uniref:alpha/beta hydrolase family protein n=1 Tax=Bifidobacterium polysaccharolyticum TaxID=2750967 RepID=UPI0028BE5136|nr:acyl-CoA thioester hydrolase/BAAT C-terminal domain-containing protein [Bifidobacterium sp. H6bp22N]MDT7507628.1 acyl-CoA thioester hydrolase/BAAT C-terminal domain-containing protein [Bifidobacterium sp. H6bp22N]